MKKFIVLVPFQNFAITAKLARSCMWMWLFCLTLKSKLSQDQNMIYLHHVMKVFILNVLKIFVDNIELLD